MKRGGSAFQQLQYRTVALVLVVAIMLVTGCTDKTTKIIYVNNSSSDGASQNPINPKALVQFQNPFIEIPIAPVSGNTYTVTIRKFPDWDYGLREISGLTGNSTRPTDPVTGAAIKTPTWYYDINGASLGIYGATVEVTSGQSSTFVYINDLRDEQLDASGNPMKGTGPLLTKHILTVDDTIDGMNKGEPEIRIVTHLHGGHVDWRYDGHPEAWITNIPASQQQSSGVSYGLAADPSRGFPGRPADNKVVYHYANDDTAATLWFHDHSYGITRLQAYAGIAAVYIVRDGLDSGDGNSLGLPAGKYANPVVPSLQSYKYDLPIVLQDKSFTADGHLVFPTFTNLGVYTFTVLRDKNGNPTQTIRPEMFGTVNMVNGQAWPTKTVERTAYRFRFVNGADSRVYNLWLEDAETGQVLTMLTATTAAPSLAWPIVQIGAEQGLLPNAVPVMTNWRDQGLTLANGERADIVIDFSHPLFQAGHKYILRNDAPAPFNGLFGPANEDMTTLDPTTTGKVMQFVISSATGSSYDTRIKAWSLANGLRPAGDFALSAPTNTRYIDFQERKDLAYAFFDPIANATFYRTQLLIDGLRFSDPITEKVSKDAVEDWVIINTTPDMHPLHLHLVKFQVIEKGHINAGSGPNPNYVRADGAGGLPEPIPAYTTYHPDFDPRGQDPSGTTTGAITPDTSLNSLYARSGNETGWKDTVKVPPAETAYDPNAGGEVVNPGYIIVRAKFSLPAGADFTNGATYMFHCHILSHEEHEMMRPYTVQ